MGRVVEKPYCGGTWSRARMFGFIRSAMRRASVRWGPKNKAAIDARRPNKSRNKRLKWEFQCADCGKWFARKFTSVHHKKSCGTLRSFDDLPAFVENLFCEVDGFELLCNKCHKKKHSLKTEHKIHAKEKKA